MTVDSMTKASSTLSSAPDMPQTPVSLTSTRKERKAAREDVRDEINRCLTKDKQAIWGARGQARKFPGWDHSSADDREQKLKEAAHSVIQQRKDRHIHVGSLFPEFRNYLPPIANDRLNRVDEEVVTLTNRQLDLLGNQRAYARAHAEEDDDEEMPPSLKKQEGEHSQELGNIPAYDPKGQARPTGNKGTARQQRGNKGNLGKPSKFHNTRVATRSTSQDNSIAEKDSEDDEKSESDLAYDINPDSDSVSEDAEEEGEKRKAVFPMVAVRRGLSLLKDTPTNATPSVKHRFSTVAGCGRKAVLRGRVANRDDEANDGEWTWVEKQGWTLGEKRACEGESDVGDCAQVVCKQAKVEADA